MKYEFLKRGVAEIIEPNSLQKRLDSGKKLRIKMGVDPTRPDLHLGHAVGLRVLKKFQDLGHTIVLIIGDYTTKIGDPTGRNTTRPVLTDKEIAANAKTYFDQAGVILDMEKTEVRYNSEWFSKMNFNDILKLAGKFTVAQLIERDDFAKRLAAGSEIGLHELLYPLMQAYDSVAVKADIEMGGTDQKFNILAGRSLQKKLDQIPQEVILVDILVGLDGKEKMSKSLGNYIGVTEDANSQFGKVMSIPDALIDNYFLLCTDLPLETIEKYSEEMKAGRNPKEIKEILAMEIVKIYHNEAEAVAAKEEFNRVFSKREVPSEMKELKLSGTVKVFDIAISTEVFSSNSEARRKIAEGAVKINNEKFIDPTENIDLKSGDVIQIGKQHFFQVK